MFTVLPSFAKINITLRVVSRRDDGFHEIVSAFLRVPSGESLRVTFPSCASSDTVRMVGLDIDVSGENVAAKALRVARSMGADIPFADITVSKAIYPGSGLGSGSGNAAALLQWLANSRPNDGIPWAEAACRTGSDVPFLFSGLPSAMVFGTGTELSPMMPPYIRGVIVLPEWDVPTSGAYAELDRLYEKSGFPVDEQTARDEAEQVMSALDFGERFGLLPNDFAPPLMEMHPQYEEFFETCDDAGCLAWGITGSGGAAFALTRTELPPVPSWARQTLCIPPIP